MIVESQVGVELKKDGGKGGARGGDRGSCMTVIIESFNEGGGGGGRGTDVGETTLAPKLGVQHGGGGGGKGRVEALVKFFVEDNSTVVEGGCGADGENEPFVLLVHRDVTKAEGEG